MGFYREDLKLEDKRWHRLFKIIFGLIIVVSIIIEFFLLKPGKLNIDNQESFKVTSTLLDKQLPARDEARVQLNSLKLKSETHIKACWGDKKGDIVSFLPTQLFDDEIDRYCKLERTKSDLDKLSEYFNNATYVRRSDGTIINEYNNVDDIRGYPDTNYTCFTNFHNFGGMEGNWLVNEPLYLTEGHPSLKCFYSPYKKSYFNEYIKHCFNRIGSIILLIIFTIIIGYILQLIYYKGIIYIIYGKQKSKEISDKGKNLNKN